jgi:hypothetical protein
MEYWLSGAELTYEDHPRLEDDVEALRAALAQPEQEPVLWINKHGHIDHGRDATFDPTKWTPLYYAPPERQPLTEQEICESLGFGSVDIEFVRMVERAHGIGGDA